MRLLLLAALCLPAASSASPRPAGGPVQAEAEAAPADCQRDPRLRMARPPGKPTIVNRLGDEPTAALALTVYRHVGGCQTPAILREGIGYTPGRAPTAP